MSRTSSLAVRASVAAVAAVAAIAIATTACSSTGIVGPAGYEANETSVSALAAGECEPLVGHFLGDDPVFVALEAGELCANRGFDFSSGDGNPSSFQCCAPSLVSRATATLGTCVDFPLGTATSCADGATWGAAAKQACAGFAASPGVGALRLSDACGDNRYRYAKVSCCSNVQNAAEVNVCAVGALVGTHDRCIADESASLQGEQTCEAEGLHFARALTVTGTCRAGTLEGEVIVCCEDPADLGDDAGSDAGVVMP